MNCKTLALFLLLGIIVAARASPAKLDDLEEERQSRSGHDDDDDEKRPYSFAWEASRHYHGAPDREHKEERGSDGITRGVFRYVDPTLRVQEVIYRADDQGFHVENTNAPEYTEAQLAERERHAQLFQKIAEEHAQIGSEHALKAAELGYEPQTYDAPVNVHYPDGNVDPALLPQFTPVLEKARNLHQDLFEKIRAQHARIASERKTNPADEETGEPYEYQYETPLKTVEVVSGSVGPSVISRAASVVSPGEDHPDFQGYGVPLGTFRDDITEEEALMLLMQADAAHIERYQSEADLHEALVLEGPGAVRTQLNHRGFSASGSGSVGNTHQGVAGRRKSLFPVGSNNGRHGNLNAVTSSVNAFRSQALNPSAPNTRTASSQQKHVSQHRTTGAVDEHSSVNQEYGVGNGRQAVNQGAGIDISAGHQDAGAAGSPEQYATGNQGTNERPLQKNAGNQGSGAGQQYSAGYQGDDGIGHNTENQHNVPLHQPTAGNLGSQANKYSAGNQVGDQFSRSHEHSASHQHTDHTSTGPQKFFSGAVASATKNTGGANFNQRDSQASSSQRHNGHDQAKFASSVSGSPQSSSVHQRPATAAQTQYTSNAGHRQSSATSRSHSDIQRPRQESNNQQQFNIDAARGQTSNVGRRQQEVSSGSHASIREAGASGQDRNVDADYEATLAIIAEQRDNHLRRFRKIAKAHEEIGDEHHQLTLAALQKQRQKIQQW